MRKIKLHGQIYLSIQQALTTEPAALALCGTSSGLREFILAVLPFLQQARASLHILFSDPQTEFSYLFLKLQSEIEWFLAHLIDEQDIRYVQLTLNHARLEDLFDAINHVSAECYCPAEVSLGKRKDARWRKNLLYIIGEGIDVPDPKWRWR